MALSFRQIARVAHGVGFRGNGLVTAVAIAYAESKGEPLLISAAGKVGLWQIDPAVHAARQPKWTTAWLRDAENNATAAFSISGGGARWNAWPTFTSGAYKKHLAAARTAVENLTDRHPASPQDSDKNGGKGSGDGDGDGKDNPRKPVEPPKTEDNPDPRVRLGRVFVHGNGLEAEIREAVTDASLSWSTSEITQLSMTISDPGFRLWRRGIFSLGVALLYREPGMDPINLRVSACSLDGGPSGLGGFVVNARSEGVYRLRRRRGPKVMKKASPSEFVEAEAKAAGLKAVCQPTAQRAHIARDLPSKGEEEATGADKPSSWTTFQRLASEVGFVVFEFMDTVYFGKPTWLLNRDKEPTQVALPLPGAEEAWVSRTMPSINTSEDAEAPVEISGIEIEKVRLPEVRPGGALRLRGLPPFNEKYLMTAMEMPLMGVGGITLSASTPINPEPQPPEPSGGSAGAYDDGHEENGSETASATQAGGKTALSFVNMAISASSASYVFGAEAAISDATPSALDCSELIQWALGRIGVPFVDGSASQIAACRSVPVATALKTRGALLYQPGHIGISLGDGRSMEARNPTAGVGIFRAADIAWTQGGLVPGLQYG